MKCRLSPVHCALCFGLLLCQSLNAQQAQPQNGPGKFTRLVWSDEFNGAGLPDSLRWTFEKGYLRNKELQYYTGRRHENAFQKNGVLHISARNDSLKAGDKIYPVTSASLTSKADWTYGRIEVRAKIPSALGTWPAIWTLGKNRSQAGWPLCGEIDILEHVGYMPDTLHFNVHTKKYNHVKGTHKGIKIHLKSPEKDFHIYAVEWYKDRIEWYLDHRKVFSFANEGTGVEAWPFDQPQYVILNLAFGGAWGGQKGVDFRSLPQTLLIDYVRVYQ